MAIVPSPSPVGHLGEFERIARYFRPLATDPAALGLTDDAAVLGLAPGTELVVTVDAMVAGVHFIGDEPARLVAQKLLRVNWSDLAAMGAVPRGCLLALSLPAACDEAWLDGFAQGLREDLASLGGALLGGDMTATPGPLTLSLTALGLVPTGAALRRNGARAGDRLWVSGSIGDAAFGLQVVQGRRICEDLGAATFLTRRYRLPEPRLALGLGLRGLATACMDVSDGLLGDLVHLCTASGVGAVVEPARLPLSVAGSQVVAADPDALTAALTGGDDYELLFTAPTSADAAVLAAAASAQTPVTPIGQIEAAPGVRVHDRDGVRIEMAPRGWTHF